MNAQRCDDLRLTGSGGANRVMEAELKRLAACFVANPKFVYAFGHRATMTKPASNANLRGTFLVFQL